MTVPQAHPLHGHQTWQDMLGKHAGKVLLLRRRPNIVLAWLPLLGTDVDAAVVVQKARCALKHAALHAAMHAVGHATTCKAMRAQ